MKITRFETFLANAGLRNYLFVRLHTDSGLTGIGEASLEWQEKTVQTLCHEWVEGRVLGRDPFDVEAVIGGMVRDQYQGGATITTGLGVELMLLEDLMRAADFVSLHSQLTPDNRGLIGAAQLALMKPTDYFVNVARGELVDQAAATNHRDRRTPSAAFSAARDCDRRGVDGRAARRAWPGRTTPGA